MSEGKERRRVREMEVVVTRVRKETSDSVTLFLASGEGRFEYQAGHFCSIDPHQFPQLEHFIAHLEDLKGKREPPRAYSLGSAPHEAEIAITIKEERYISGETPYPPVLSPLLTHHTPVGTQLVISGFSGGYTLTPDIVERVDRVVHVCAGSGIVPNLGLVKASLHRGDPVEHILLYSNKTRQDIIYYQDFEELHQQYPDKFDVVHCITRQDPAGLRNSRRGRISAELLREYIPDLSSSFVFTCGPGISPHERRAARERNEKPEPRFVENMVATLRQIGLEKKQIKQESWG